MSRPPLAAIEDLVTAGIEVPYEQEGPAQSLLERASAIVRAFAGRLWLNEDGDELLDVPPDIPGVVVGMVERATHNPGGVTQEVAGPFSRSFGSDAASRLYLTKNDKLVIRFAIGASGLSTIPTTRGPVETPNPRRFPDSALDAAAVLE